jgi:hypothetical protein
MNGSGSVDGVFVMPCPRYLTIPVGLSGVPPQVQVVLACAEAAPPRLTAEDATASALMARIVRGVMCLLS